MPYNESDAARLRTLLKPHKSIAEKKMFGGIGFLLKGNMCVGLWKEFLILRVDPETYHDLLQEPHVKEFDITGRSMSGWIMVKPEGFADDASLHCWINLAVGYVSALPKKTAANKKPMSKSRKK